MGVPHPRKEAYIPRMGRPTRGDIIRHCGSVCQRRTTLVHKWLTLCSEGGSASSTPRDTGCAGVQLGHRNPPSFELVLLTSREPSVLVAGR